MGVHTTRFAIRDSKIGLFEPVLQLGIEEMRAHPSNPLAIAGICGDTPQAVSEATLAHIKDTIELLEIEKIYFH